MILSINDGGNVMTKTTTNNENVIENTLMTTEELRQLSTEEIRKRINELSKNKKKSSKEVMQEYGYGFTWGVLRDEALVRGLVQGYIYEDDTQTDFREYHRPQQKEIIIDLDRVRDKKLRRPITFDKEVADKLDILLRDFKKDADKSKVYDVIFRLGLDVLFRAIAKGNVRIVRSVPELNISE